MNEFSPKKFWEEKILSWEDARYKKSMGSPLLERLANHLSDSLRFRLEVGSRILSQHVHGKKVVEIGCGSGLLAETLIANGAERYVGYDIAGAAIDNARKLARDRKLGDRAQFHVAGLGDLGGLDADIVFSFGLLDWLTNDEIDHLFRISGDADWLHAISEKRRSLARLIHALYVYVAYGHRTGGYVPKYHTVDEIAARSSQGEAKNINIFRHPRLSFGALLTSLPLPDEP